MNRMVNSWFHYRTLHLILLSKNQRMWKLSNFCRSAGPTCPIFCQSGQFFYRSGIKSPKLIGNFLSVSRTDKFKILSVRPNICRSRTDGPTVFIFSEKTWIRTVGSTYEYTYVKKKYVKNTTQETLPFCNKLNTPCIWIQTKKVASARVKSSYVYWG